MVLYLVRLKFRNFGIFATTGSNGFNGSQSITGSLTVTGQVVAQTLNVQQVTSSIVYSSGSNIFGNTLANTQQFTGSVSVTGSFAVTTTGTELQVTSTGVNMGNALTDSHIISGSLRVNPNGLFVSGSGNVGVGTTTPTQGKVEIQQSTTTAALWVQTGGTTSASTIADFRTGTNLPALQILGDGTATFGSSVTATRGFFSSNAASDSTTALLANASTNDSTTYAALFGSLNAGYRMVVRADGNVGIGLNSPPTRLSLVGGSTMQFGIDGNSGNNSNIFKRWYHW